jgi:hypothetical protein
MQSEFPWFSHDAEARNNKKLRILRNEYKNDGYAWYFMLLEILRAENEHILNMNEELTRRFVITELGMEPKAFDKFIELCVSIRLFIFDEGYLWSSGLKARLQKREQNLVKWRENGMKGGRPITKRKPK